HYLRNVTSKEVSPDDWCYVYNFHLPQKPIALQFLPGVGEVFKQQMKELTDHLHYAIPYLFNSREYRSRIEKIELKYKNMEDRYFSKIQKEAKKNALGIVETLGNYEVVPLVNDEQMTDAQLDALSESEIKDLKNKM
ncbi:MAG TPA: AAA family ATPase, partial [Candidatus Berkiella sp.]|nr:AAA family ATPase [Candidatus Berkiella sp.]